jgi:anti-sigma factor RsiW
MTCPNDETLVDFLEGRLSEAQRGPVEEHLAACGPCREQVAVCAELMEGEAENERVTAPQALTQKTIDRVRDLTRPVKVPGILERTRQWVAKGVQKIDHLAIWSAPDPVTLRSGSQDGVQTVITRQKTFDHMTFQIELEKIGVAMATIRVFIEAPVSTGSGLRVALYHVDRELASADIGPDPVLFEEIQFGVYTLIFMRLGEKLGEYPFEIADSSD